MKNTFLLFLLCLSIFGLESNLVAQTCSSGQTAANSISGSTYSVSQTFIPCNNGRLSGLRFYPAYGSSGAGLTITITDSQGQSTQRSVSAGSAIMNLDYTSYNYAVVSGETYTINFTTPAANAFGVKLRYSSDASSYPDGTLSGAGGTGDLYFLATVEENELPTNIGLTSTTVNENESANTAVGTLSSTDADAGDTHTYSLSGTDASSFTVNGNSLETASSFDFETKNSYDITITTTDSKSGSFSKDFTIGINNVNEAISIVNPLDDIVVNANFVETISVATVFSDTDGDDLTYSVTSSNTNAVGVSVDNTANTIMVFDNDITNQGNVTISVTADDGNGETAMDEFSITLFDPGATPTDISLDNLIVVENQDVGSTVGQLSTTDADVNDTHSYTISGTDASSFQLDGSTLETASVFDYESKTSYDIIITTDDGNNTFDKAFTITVQDEKLEKIISKYTFTNDFSDSLGIYNAVAVGSPTFTEDRNQNAAAALLTSTNNFARVSDPVINLNGDYSINAYVRLDQPIGAQGQFILSSRYDDNSFPQGGMILNVNSDKKLGLAYYTASGTSQTQVFNIVDTDDFPVGQWQMVSVTKIGTDIKLYRNAVEVASRNFTGGFDNGVRWNIGAFNGGNGVQHFQGAIDDLSFHGKGMTIGELERLYQEVFTAPSDLNLSHSAVGSGLPAGTLVGFLTTVDVDESETHTYTISGLDATSFSIDDDKLVTSEEFDMAVKSSYEITLTSTDNQGLSFDKPYTITIEDAGFESGLRGLYTFNNGSLTNVSEEQFAAPDAIAVGTPTSTSDRNGSTNRALQISPDNFARINSNVVGDGSFMISGWFRLDGDIASGIQVILDSRQDAQGNEQGGFTLSLDSDEKIDLNFFIYPSSQFFQNVLSLKSTESVSVGEWNMFTITRTSTNSNRRVTFYLNGRNIMAGDLQQVQSIPPYDPGSIFTIGAQGVSNRELNGAVDDLHFTTQWTQTEIHGLLTRPELNAAPSDILLSISAIDENNAIGDLVGTLSTTDVDENDSHSYTLSGTDAASFSIDGNSLSAAEVFDFETQETYDITITTTDGDGSSFSKDFTVSINDLAENSAPTNITLDNTAILENEAIGSIVGSFSTTDPNSGDSHTYSLSGTDANSFSIEGNSLKTVEVFDFETKASYTIEVTSTDQDGLSFAKSFAITIQDLDENTAPSDITLDNNSINENAAIGTLIGEISTVDEDKNDVHTYALTGTDASSFAIDGNNLNSAVVFDFETKASFEINITTTDSNGASFTKGFTITINDQQENENSAPTDINLSNNSIGENQDVGSLVGILTSVDLDTEDSHSYSLSGLDASSFSVSGSNLLSAEVFDFESKDDYTVTVTSTDDSGLSFTKDFTINVTDVDENNAPSDISIGSTTVVENSAIGTLVGLLSTTDSDEEDTHTYTLSGSDAPSFSIGVPANSETSQLGLLTNEVFDFEMKSTYQISIVTSDGNGGDFTKDFTISVNNLNEAPSQIRISGNSIEENQSEGLFIGFFTTVDPDNNDSHTISLGGEDASSFSTEIEFIEGAGNVFVLRSAEVFDFEERPSYRISVTSTDASGLFITQEFTINVTDLEPENNAPTAISLSRTSIDENEAIGTTIGELTTADPDESDIHSYTLSGDDSESFSIEENELKTNESFDFETKSSYEFFITSDDGNGGTITQSFTIEILDVNETESALSVSSEIDIKTYPNPAVDFVTIEINQTEEGKALLMDLKGNVVKTADLQKTRQIDLRNLKSGIYLLKVSIGQKTTTEKLLVR